MVSMRERRIHQYREFSSLRSASSLVHSTNIFGWFGFVHLDWLNLKEDNVYKGIFHFGLDNGSVCMGFLLSVYGHIKNGKKILHLKYFSLIG